MDYAINGDLDVYFTEWGDFATVSGREEFEQDLVVHLRGEQESLLGPLTNDDTVKERIQLAVTRTAREFGVIDSIEHVSIDPHPTRDDGVEVNIFYNTGESFSETV